MDSDSSERYTRLNQILEEVAARFRRGERPELQSYLDNYPDLADDIRDLFPAMAEIEQVNEDRRDASSRGPDAALPPLQQLGEYRILREIGRGGMGVVYEAEQESLGRHVALKVLPAHTLLDPRQVQRFQREARAAARLHHTNIVPVFGVGEHDGLHFYVMQFINGQGLDQVLEELKRLRKATGKETATTDRRPNQTAGAVSLSSLTWSLVSGQFSVDEAPTSNQEKPLDTHSPTSLTTSEVYLPGQQANTSMTDSGRQYWQSVARIGIQVAEALAYAHAQGTLHRDIKPSNLLLDAKGTVWVTDFGLAKTLDSEDLTHTGDVVGTLRYLPPERFHGKGDARSDLYSLGLTLYELLTFRAAFDAGDRKMLLAQVMHAAPPAPRKINPLAPRDLETIVLKLIARDSDDRYQTGTELAEDLRQFMDDRPIRARQVSELEKLWRWCRRNPVLAGMICALFVALALGAAGTGWKWREAVAERRKVVDAERETSLQRDKAIQARNQAQRVLAGVMLDKGIALAEYGEIGEGLLWMLEGLKVAPKDETDLQQAIRHNIAGWMSQTHHLQQFIDLPLLVGPCAFSADGSRIWTASADGDTILSAMTAEPVANRPNPEKQRAAAVSPDWKWRITVAAPGNDKPTQVQRWDFATGHPVGAPLSHPGPIGLVVFSHDGKLFATACDDRRVRIWDTSTGNSVNSGLPHEQRIKSLAFSPDNRKLVVGTAGAPYTQEPAAGHLWDVASGKRQGGPLRHQRTVQCVAFSPDGKTVLTGSEDHTAQLWDAASGEPLGPPLRHSHEVYSASFAPDGRTIVTGAKDGVVRWWDTATRYQLIGLLSLNWGSIVHLAFAPDGKTLASVSDSGARSKLHIWRIARPLSRPAGQGKEAVLKASWAHGEDLPWYGRQSIAYTPDGSRVLAGGMEGFAHLTDAASGSPAGPPLRHNWEKIHVLAASPDGRFFATSSMHILANVAIGDASLWEAGSGRLIPMESLGNWVAAMAFSPDSKMLATGGYDGSVRFWDAATGKLLGSPLPQGAIVQSLAFKPDGTILAVGLSVDQTGTTGVRLWDVASRMPLGPTIPGSKERLQFSPDGARLLIGEGSSLRILDASNVSAGNPVAPIVLSMTDVADVNGIAFSSDGQTILTGSTDGSARQWDAASGKPIGAPLIHPHRINVVLFSPDPQSRFILVGCADGSARIWDRMTQKPLGPAYLLGKPIFDARFLADGRSFLTTAEDGSTRKWQVPAPTDEETDRLMLRLQVLSGLEIGEGQSVRHLSASEWRQRREQLRELDGEAEGDGLIGDAEFHDARAKDAEQELDFFAAIWHLDRLIALLNKENKPHANDKPDPSFPIWLAYARRAHVHRLDGHDDRADADYAEARRFGTAQMLQNWYRRRAIDCKAAKRWMESLWYLERAIAFEPNDWQLYAERALIHEKLGDTGKFTADMKRAVGEGASASYIAKLANRFVEMGMWRDAAAMSATARKQGDLSPIYWHGHTLAALKAGDHDGYRDICAGIVRMKNRIHGPFIENSAAWACTLGPDALDDFTLPISFAESALRKAGPTGRTGVLNTLGAILYRAGRFKESIERLKQSMAGNDKGAGNVHDWVFLAMAYHRMGDKTEAQRFLAQVKKHPPPKESLIGVEIEMLRREAQELIEGKSFEEKR